MRIVTSSLVAAGAVAGIAGAVFAYQSAASTGTGTTPVSRSVPPPDPTPEVRVRWLPCESGTSLVDGTCVRIREHVVVADTPEVRPVPTRTPRQSSNRSGSGDDDGRGSSAGPTSTPAVDDDDHEDHEEFEDHEEHEDDD